MFLEFFYFSFLLNNNSLKSGTGLPVPALTGELCDAVAAISI
jgi:hypothetical protein